ncbi:MAG: HAMP domain-containing protein [Elusimicrobia bacterium]|nr:HAMP domain-containing protein [Elusimicrobiota bacterium]
MIGRRFIALAIVMVGVAGSVVAGLFVRHAGEIIQEQIEHRGRILLQAVAKQAMEAIRHGDFGAGLEGVVRSLKLDPDVDIAIVVDSEGNILAHSDEKKKGSKLFLSLWDQDVMKSAVPMIRHDKSNARYIIGMAIQGPRSFREGDIELMLPTGQSAISLGAIYVGLSEAKIREHINQTILFVAASLGAIVLGASVIVALFTKRIVRPLHDLNRATQELAGGNLNAQVKVASEDEVGQLATSFNKMTKRLRETTISKNQLESIVEQKTKAIKDANETLLETNMELKRLQELESNFVSMASHELRTPLTSISGFTTLMLKYAERLTKEQMTNYLNAIVAETARLGRMVNEVLDLKKIQSGKIELHVTRVDVKALAEKVANELRMRPDQPHYKVLCETQQLFAMLDEDKTKQILINITGNSAKYTPVEKFVYIELSLVNERTLVINIRDEGSGIPKELWSRLFRPFARATDEKTRKMTGTGLGLAITKSLVETMGGKIRAENLKTGAQFTVVLPRGMDLSPAQTPQKEAAAPAAHG